MLGVKIYTLLLLRWLHNPMFGLYLSFCTKKCQNVSKKEMWRNVSKKCEMRNVSKFRIFMVTARLILEHLPAVRLMQWGMQRDMQKKPNFFSREIQNHVQFSSKKCILHEGRKNYIRKTFLFPHFLNVLIYVGQQNCQHHVAALRKFFFLKCLHFLYPGEMLVAPWRCHSYKSNLFYGI